MASRMIENRRDWCERNVKPYILKRIVWCRNCDSKKASRNGNLCFTCYEDEDIRKRYVKFCSTGNCVDVKHGTKVGSDNALPVKERFIPLDPNPTQFLPGTYEKIAVMEYRARNGYQIFHPLDKTFEGVCIDSVGSKDGEEL